MFLIVWHSFPRHEEEVGEVARDMGFSQVSLSSRVMPMVRMVPRGYTGETTSLPTVRKLCIWPSSSPLVCVATVIGPACILVECFLKD